MKPHYTNTDNPIDFPKTENKMTLIDRVLKQIELDVKNRDFTAIEELLQHVPEDILEGFISECITDRDYDDPMDGDHDSAMASAGWGTDEDYGGGCRDDGC